MSGNEETSEDLLDQRETANIDVAARTRQKKDDEKEEDLEIIRNLEMLMEENLKDESCFWPA